MVKELYGNVPVSRIESEIQDVRDMINKVGEIPGSALNYGDASRLTQMLIEYRKCLQNEIKSRNQ